MSKFGRVMGHGMGGFFLVLGAAFLVLGFNEGFTSSIEANSTCQPGSCAEGGVKMTFLILGASFVGTAVLLSFFTEFAIRKTRTVLDQVSTLTADGSANGIEEVADFLKPFGIDIDSARNANVTVGQRTIDLRGQRTGEVPTDAASLGGYLKSFGINIDKAMLRNATVVRHGEVVQMAGADGGSEPFRAEPTHESSSRRETATIVRKRDRGETSGNQRLLEFELEVRPAGKVPYRVQVASLARESLAGLLIEGSMLNVRVGTSDDQDVTIDWSEN